jgi:hypothetical protein
MLIIDNPRKPIFHKIQCRVYAGSRDEQNKIMGFSEVVYSIPAPAGIPFLLIRQKKVTKEKTIQGGGTFTLRANWLRLAPLPKNPPPASIEVNRLLYQF